MIGCSHVSSLEVRPYTCRGPVLTYADEVQITLASAKLGAKECFSWTRPVRSVCTLPFPRPPSPPTHQRRHREAGASADPRYPRSLLSIAQTDRAIFLARAMATTRLLFLC